MPTLHPIARALACAIALAAAGPVLAQDSGANSPGTGYGNPAATPAGPNAADRNDDTTLRGARIGDPNRGSDEDASQATGSSGSSPATGNAQAGRDVGADGKPVQAVTKKTAKKTAKKKQRAKAAAQ